MPPERRHRRLPPYLRELWKRVFQCNIQNNVVSPILTAAHLDPTLVKNFALNNVVLNPSSTPTVDSVSVSLGYPYNFTLNGVTCCPFALKPIATGVKVQAGPVPDTNSAISAPSLCRSLRECEPANGVVPIVVAGFVRLRPQLGLPGEYILPLHGNFQLPASNWLRADGSGPNGRGRIRDTDKWWHPMLDPCWR